MGMIGRIMPMQMTSCVIMAVTIVVTVSMFAVIMGGMAGRPRTFRSSGFWRIMMGGKRHR